LENSKEVIKLQEELAASKEFIERLAYDELTGLLIRQAFLQRAEQKIKENPSIRYGIIALDFENFKSSNSLYGEDRCNEFLSYVSRRLKEKLPDCLVGRFGGDQFVILFDTEKNYMALIDSYKSLILKDSPIPSQVVKFGIYTPIDKSLLLVRCCDRAFLAIKQIKGVYGKQIAFYEDSMQQQILDERKIVESMETSLANGDFRVYYQPKHESVTDKIAGAEALVRWQHPVYGFMNPGQFIPLFERNGFITKLDTFIVEQVCKDINRWKNEGFPIVPISVNISRRDFLEPGCIENQLSIIEKNKIDHNLIHIEVTESMYADDTNIIVSKVRETQDLGFLIEMDDFGAGYSSLGLLSTFPLDVLKLDITFVRNIDVNKIVIENIIKMAHRMSLFVVAEGVETEVQYKILKGLGCDLIQGFFFSRPLTVEDFEKYLRKYSTTVIHKNNKETIGKLAGQNSEQMLLLANEVSEGIPGGFMSAYVEGLEVISVNRELLSIYECESIEEFRAFTDNNVRNMVHPDDFDTALANSQTQLSPENSLYTVEHRIITKKGNTRYVRDYGRFVKTEKYGEIYFVFIYDITEEILREKKAVELLKERLRLERSAEVAKKSSEAKTIFMSNLVNDVLPIVKDIVITTEKAEKNIDDREALLNNIKGVKQGHEQLLAFVNNLQEIGRQELGITDLNEVPTDASEAAKRIYDIFSKEAAKKNITVEYWSKIYDPFIFQDVKITMNVVFNIMTNAIKYTPEGGKIVFGLEQTPGMTDEECFMSFVCEDTGIGMSEDFLPHACEPFAREDNAVNQEHKSSGYGLNIVYNLLMLQKGTIDITSVQGKGTKVVTSQPHRFTNAVEGLDAAATLAGSIKL